MVWLIYRRAGSFHDQRRKEPRLGSFDELFDSLLQEMFGTSYVAPEHRMPLRQRGRPVPESLHDPGIREECEETIRHHSREPATQPCSRCGIRFSTNLMEDGLCHNCRSEETSEWERRSGGDRAGSPPISDQTLKEAYRILGCDEEDSDEVVKRRHRELAKEFHTDCIAPGASADRIQTCNERFSKAQEAYEIVMIARTKTS